MTAVSLAENKGLIRQMAERGVDIFVYIYANSDRPRLMLRPVTDS